MFCNFAANKLPVVTMKTLQSKLMMGSYQYGVKEEENSTYEVMLLRHKQDAGVWISHMILPLNVW